MNGTLGVLSTRDRERVGMLVHSALDLLWESTDGCCPECCAPCAVLAELLESGQLDAWATAWDADGTLAESAWWDAGNQCIDRQWLEDQWSRADKLGCHDESDPSVTAEEQQ